MEAVAPDRKLSGRYRIEEVIATGGMATVWRALDEVLARSVALKVLRDDLAADPAFLVRFRREAIAAAALNHPAIVNVFDTGAEEGNVFYIVMEHFDGVALSEILATRGALPPSEVVSLSLPVLSALEYAHESGVIHRDVKPGNILVAPDGRVKVTDFGIAKAAFAGGGTDITTTGTVLGTVRYLSPEQVKGEEVDPRSDLYSLGVVMYEMLAGQVPFQGDSDVATAMLRLTTDPPPPGALQAGIPRSLESVVLRAMAREPEARFTSATAMRAALERALGPPAASLAAAPAPTVEARRPYLEPVERRSGRGLLVLIPILLLLAAVAGVGLFLANWLREGDVEVTPTPSRTQVAATRRLAPASAADFDPYGDDGSENPEEVRFAIDGDPSTAWTTVRYETEAFGNLKPGLGLWVDFGRRVELDRFVVTSTIPGWTFELRPGSEPSDDNPAAAGASGAETFTMGEDGSISVDLEDVSARGVLIWITSLAPAEGGYKAAVAEVSATGIAR